MQMSFYLVDVKLTEDVDDYRVDMKNNPTKS